MPDFLTSCGVTQARAPLVIASLFAAFVPLEARAHGLIESPPSRNWMCGATTKPDQANGANAKYPECADAFETDRNGGYQFMSVLTHGPGRAGKKSKNVCGFDSETWHGGASPWDAAIAWPTTPMKAGQQRFTWNISWGPHFDDTTDFRYWITKPSFRFEEGRPLSWSDFEEQPFCNLQYSDKNPTANPDITADKAKALFHTVCTVPARQGHHVIYGEWGRGPSTFERFHGCVDAAF